MPREIGNSVVDMVVLGNGPSLKRDLIRVREEKLNTEFFAVNYFANSSEFGALRPKNYVFLDPQFWRDGFPQEIVDRRNLLFSIINDLTTWSMVIYFPCRCNIKQLEKLFDNTNIKVCLYNSEGIPFLSSKFYYFLMKFGLAAPSGANVLSHAIYLSVMLGYRSVRVIGANASWHENLIIDQHSNDLHIEMKHHDGVTLVKRYQDDQQNIPANISWTFMFLAKTFDSFDQVAAFASKQGVSVVNKSSFSYIDSFSRTNCKN